MLEKTRFLINRTRNDILTRGVGVQLSLNRIGLRSRMRSALQECTSRYGCSPRRIMNDPRARKVIGRPLQTESNAEPNQGKHIW